MKKEMNEEYPWKSLWVSWLFYFKCTYKHSYWDCVWHIRKHHDESPLTQGPTSWFECVSTQLRQTTIGSLKFLT